MVFAFIITNIAWFIACTFINDYWHKLCQDQNHEWAEHCMELIDKFYREEIDDSNRRAEEQK